MCSDGFHSNSIQCFRIKSNQIFIIRVNANISKWAFSILNNSCDFSIDVCLCMYGWHSKELWIHAPLFPLYICEMGALFNNTHICYKIYSHAHYDCDITFNNWILRAVWTYFVHALAMTLCLTLLHLTLYLVEQYVCCIIFICWRVYIPFLNHWRCHHCLLTSLFNKFAMLLCHALL